MANFEISYKRMIKNEGFYTKKPNETYMGIDRKYNPDWEGWDKIDWYKKTIGPIRQNENLMGLGLEEKVIKFYKEKYWNKMHGDKIINQGIADNFFDFFINSGKAAKRMQQALNDLGFNLEVDNVVGPMTINAINTANPVKLNYHFNEARIRHYKSLVIDDPSQYRFLAGWLNRVEHFRNVS